MKTAEEMYYDQFGKEPTWDDVFVAKEYAKQLLEEYTNRIVENVKTSFDSANNVIVDKESITSQLKPFIKSLV